MKRYLYKAIFISFACTVLFSCSKKNEKKQSAVAAITEYYLDYADKFSHAETDDEVDTLAYHALLDYREIVYEHKDELIEIYKRNRSGELTDESPEMKGLKDALLTCNRAICDKSKGKWDYMPDFNDVIYLLHEYLPKEPSEGK